MRWVRWLRGMGGHGSRSTAGPRDPARDSWGLGFSPGVTGVPGTGLGRGSAGCRRSSQEG